jgi:hypothetical protein
LLSHAVIPVINTQPSINWENTADSNVFVPGNPDNGRPCYARRNRKTSWKHWCKVIFSLCSALCLGEEGTTPLTLQLGECAACGKAMFSSTAAFENIETLKENTTHHQVFYTPTRHFLEAIALISCSGSLYKN